MSSRVFRIAEFFWNSRTGRECVSFCHFSAALPFGLGQGYD
jgi:hypothetical protein